MQTAMDNQSQKAKKPHLLAGPKFAFWALATGIVPTQSTSIKRSKFDVLSAAIVVYILLSGGEAMGSKRQCGTRR